MLQLVKFQELATLLGLEKPSMDDYPALKLLAASVYAAIESYTGRYLERGQYTEEVTVDGRSISLRALPIVSIESLSFEGADLAPDQSERRDWGLALITPLSGRIIASYEGGYEQAPEAIKRAALLQIAHEYQRKEQVGATNVTGDGGSTFWPELTLLKEVKRLLDEFVHPQRIF
jgi:hypothetical protein